MVLHAITLARAVPAPEPDAATSVDRGGARRYLMGTVVAFIGGGAAMALLGYRLATPLFLAAFLAWLRVPARILVPFVAVGSALIYGSSR